MAAFVVAENVFVREFTVEPLGQYVQRFTGTATNDLDTVLGHLVDGSLPDIADQQQGDAFGLHGHADRGLTTAAGRWEKGFFVDDIVVRIRGENCLGAGMTKMFVDAVTDGGKSDFHGKTPCFSGRFGPKT